MKKILLPILVPFLLSANFAIYTVPSKVKKQMLSSGSWKKGCPVALSDLRYLRLDYYGFDRKVHRDGEMIVHKSVARDVVDLFRKLLESHYPIKQMKLVSKYGASDYDSIEADNTSAFNCRPVTGGKKWSNHSYGKAIDINPIENPYISKSGRIAHSKSLKYRIRKHINYEDPADNAIIVKGDYIERIFKEKGWRWGGDWRYVKDYQHFDKPVRHRPNAK
jgi:poly-gamma-glutamate synthesis protein (capsule biosynthesis protein)